MRPSSPEFLRSMRGPALAALAAATSGFGADRVVPAEAYLLAGEVRTFAITYTATVSELPAGSRRLRLWIPVPQDSIEQQIGQLTFSRPPHLTTENKYGNRIAWWDFPAPRASEQVTMRFVCRRRELRTDLARLEDRAEQPAARFAVFRRPTARAVIDGRVRQLAEQVTAGKRTTVERCRAIYDYVVRHMRYDKSQPGWGTGSTTFACTTGGGNCTDFHSLFNSLCRAEGIATAFEIGLYLPYDRGEAGPLGAYHCWTLFRVPGETWVPVDCSEARRETARREYLFGNHTANRVTFSIGRDIDLVPRQHGPALNFFIEPYAEVDGVPIAATKTWSFRDVKPPATLRPAAPGLDTNNTTPSPEPVSAARRAGSVALLSP